MKVESYDAVNLPDSKAIGNDWPLAVFKLSFPLHGSIAFTLSESDQIFENSKKIYLPMP